MVSLGFSSLTISIAEHACDTSREWATCSRCSSKALAGGTIERAEADASGGILGAVGLAAFAAITQLLLPRIGPLALVAAPVVWVLASVALYVAVRIRVVGR